jgi:hypothetical protein
MQAGQVEGDEAPPGGGRRRGRDRSGVHGPTQIVLGMGDSLLGVAWPSVRGQFGQPLAALGEAGPWPRRPAI